MKQLTKVQFPKYTKNSYNPIPEKQPNQKMGKRPKKTFLQRRHTEGQKPHEKVLNTANYQSIKITVRYHLALFRMSIIEKSTNNKCWRGCGEKGNLHHCL